MSCYFRHLNTLFAEVGIQVTPANRKEIDRVFHEIMGVTYKECPATWRKLKLELADEVKRKELVRKLKRPSSQKEYNSPNYESPLFQTMIPKRFPKPRNHAL